jgi:hypothetical protein
MKTYPLTSTLLGVLTDDYLYFEGTARPQAFYTIEDGKLSPTETRELEQYWNDIYNLFLRKLTLFAGSIPMSEEETLKLQALLQELIKIKNLIEKAGETDIMGG